MNNKENRIWQWVAHLFLGGGSLLCIAPFVLLTVSSITSEKVILQLGYSFFPSEISFDAYKYLWRTRNEIFKAYGITVFITVVGTVLSLGMGVLLAYPLSRKDLPYRNVFAFLVFFTLLFNGGLVPTYLVYTQIFNIQDTIWALIFPMLLLNGFYVLLMRTFFSTSIPDALLEAAKIDGAGEWRTLGSIVLPLSTPIMATIGLFQAVRIWNDWMNGLVFLTNTDLYSLQVLLNRILQDIQFLRTSELAGHASEGMSQLPGASIRMAIATIGVLPMLLAYPFFQKYLKKGIALGAIKG